MTRSLQQHTTFISLLLFLVAGAARVDAAPWLPLGPDGGDARRISRDPSDHKHLYLGTANGWIYESHTSGTSWLRLAQVGKRDNLVLDSIVVDTRNPQHLLVGAWVIDRPDGGVFASNDGGHTWTNQAEMRGQSVRSLAASPSDPSMLVAGSLQGVFRSTDAGQHWSRISPADSAEIHEVESVAVDPKDPDVVYAGTWHLPWKTTDAGQHWAAIKQGIIDDSDVFSIIVDPTSPQTVYASACSGIYKSEDAGSLFHKVEGIPSTARRTRVLLQDPQQLDIIFAGTTEGLFRTNDAGKTWIRTTGPEIIVNDVSVDPADSHRVLIATDHGGVMASDDGGNTFISSNSGLSTRQITAIKRDDRHPQTLFVGVVNDKEWGGVFESENGGVNWIQRSDGLQGLDVFSLGQAPDGTMIAGTVHGIYRLDSSINTWQRAESLPEAAFDPVRPTPSSNLTRPPMAVSHSPSAQKITTERTSLISPATKPRKRSASKSYVDATERRPDFPRRAVTATKKASSVDERGRAVLLRSATSKQVSAKSHFDVAPRTSQSRFDVAVYSVLTVGSKVFAATASGLLTSIDNGLTWATTGRQENLELRLLASAGNNVVVASRHEVRFSSDMGVTWSPLTLPRQLTQISALALEPSGEIWLGGREGVFISADAGNKWSTPKNLDSNSVNSIFYDEMTHSITITTASEQGVVFTVQLPQRSVAYYESGWNLRFACPVGDHLVAATLFDGLVLQPRIIAFPIAQTVHSMDMSPSLPR